MGIRVRKSFKIVPGVKLNVGKKSAGISIGGKGLRYSINSKTGSRTTIGIPGSGISYTTSGRGYNSSAYSRNSELKKIQREQAKMQELERNKLEVEIYENKIEMIKSIHKECDQNIDWNEILKFDPPFNFEAGEKGVNELNAIKRLENYKPSIIDKLFSKDIKKIEELKLNIEHAINKDKEDYLSWQNLIKVAKRIVNKDIDAYFEVIDDFKPLDDLLEFGSGFEFFIEDNNWLEIDFDVNTEKVIPKQVKLLTKTGKVSVKQMAKTNYFDIQQDYVCSCAIRIARDMFALLPIDYVIINSLDNRLDTSTGKLEKEVILSAKIEKETLSRLNMDLIDPSDSMENFEYNMEFKKTGGLNKVCRLRNL